MSFIAVATALCVAPLIAQESIAQVIRRVNTGAVRLQFKARNDVCGNGQSASYRYGRWTRGDDKYRGEWISECEPGPVRVAMDVVDGAPTSIRFYVGGRWSGVGNANDVGSVAAADAGAWFVGLAETGTGSVARDAVTVATLADSSVVWPTLLRIAKDASRERELRKSAVFWIGQAASDAAADLRGLAEDESGDIDVRKQAVFALSQRPAGEGVAPLLSIAKSRLDARIRKHAIFWLGQSGDPRVLAYFEEVLTKPE